MRSATPKGTELHKAADDDYVLQPNEGPLALDGRTTHIVLCIRSKVTYYLIVIFTRPYL